MCFIRSRGLIGVVCFEGLVGSESMIWIARDNRCHQLYNALCAIEQLKVPQLLTENLAISRFVERVVYLLIDIRLPATTNVYLMYTGAELADCSDCRKLCGCM